MNEIEKRKVAIYDLMRKISQASAHIKEWQEELRSLDNEILQLEVNDG